MSSSSIALLGTVRNAESVPGVLRERLRVARSDRSVLTWVRVISFKDLEPIRGNSEFPKCFGTQQLSRAYTQRPPDAPTICARVFFKRGDWFFSFCKSATALEYQLLLDILQLLRPRQPVGR
jgi:hypothetical protein